MPAVSGAKTVSLSPSRSSGDGMETYISFPSVLINFDETGTLIIF